MMRVPPLFFPILLAGLMACSSAPPAETPETGKGQGDAPRVDAEEARRRDVRYRLTEQLAHGTIPLNDLTCRVGDEIRPSLGCLRQAPLRAGKIRTDAEGRHHVRASVRKALRDQQLIVERSVKGGGVLDWKDLPPVLIPRGVPVFSTEIVSEDPKAVELWARPIPPSDRHFRTRPLRVPPGARLQVGVGMDPFAAELGAQAAALRLVAESDGDRTPLLETVVPGDSRRWVDHEIDLGAFAGKDVAFHFVSMPAVGADADGFTAPLWGAPLLTAESPEPTSSEPPNVILISLDTLRADYVGRKRLGRDLTPNLDRFRARGTVFTNAMTTYPSTTGSHMSLFTGLYSATHGTTHARKKLPPEIPTLAEAMASVGYATSAVTENAMLNAGSGFLRGFDSYREQKGDDVWSTDGAITQTFDDGLAWLDAHGDERFFLFLHTYQVHYPYTPPGRHDHFRKAVKGELPEESFERQKVWAERGYAGEVLYTDEEVGRLIEALESRDLLANTVVVITADHGEEFGEHGDIGHAETLHAEVMDIPMSIYFPARAPAGLAVEEPVSLVDVLSTVLEFAGLSAENVQGRSLVPLLEGRDFGPPRAIYAQNFGKHGAQMAARTADHAFLFRGQEKLPHLVYDRRKDPGEQNPIESAELSAMGAEWIEPYRASIIEAITTRLKKQKKTAAKRETEDPERRLDSSVVKKLRALGYMD